MHEEPCQQQCSGTHAATDQEAKLLAALIAEVAAHEPHQNRGQIHRRPLDRLERARHAARLAGLNH